MARRRFWLAALLLILLLMGCARQPTPPPAITSVPTAIPAAVGRPRSGTATASGNVLPAQKADLSFFAAGRLQTLAVDVGDQVEAGELLAALDSAVARAAVAQANAALLRAQANLAQVQAGPLPQEVAAAQARLDAIQAHLTQLSEGVRTEEVAAAEADLAAAQAAFQQLFSGPSEPERITAQAALANAEAALQQAQAAYDKVAWSNDVAMLPESRLLQEATNNYEAAKARYDVLFADPPADAVAAAQARIQQAQAALDRLRAPATAGQIAEAEAQVRAAQAEHDLLAAGSRQELIAAAEAGVAEAEAQLQRAQAELASTELHAPFAGTITALNANPGEMVLPGQVVLTLADLRRLQVETTDLSERDVGRVAPGQPVTVFVEALNTEIPGRVTRIAPQATVIGGDVVYTVVIELNEQPSTLRWGMSVDVDIEAD